MTDIDTDAHQQSADRTSNRDLLIRLDERTKSMLDTLTPLGLRVEASEQQMIRVDGRLLAIEGRVLTLETRPAPPAQLTPEQAAIMVRVIDWFDGRTSFRRAIPGMIAGAAISGVTIGLVLPHLQSLGH